MPVRSDRTSSRSHWPAVAFDFGCRMVVSDWDSDTSKGCKALLTGHGDPGSRAPLSLQSPSLESVSSAACL